MGQKITEWIASQIDANMFDGCENYMHVHSIIADCDNWDYEFTQSDAIGEACAQLGIEIVVPDQEKYLSYMMIKFAKSQGLELASDEISSGTFDAQFGLSKNGQRLNSAELEQFILAFTFVSIDDYTDKISIVDTPNMYEYEIHIDRDQITGDRYEFLENSDNDESVDYTEDPLTAHRD